jgi:hypothetical protein
VLALAFVLVPSARAAELTTDKADYAPGETVNIFGTLFDALQNVVLTIVGQSEDGSTAVNDSWNVDADDAGSFTTSYDLPNFYVPLYLLAANSETGEVLAETSFTDSISFNSLTVGAQSPNPVIVGNSASYLVSVTFNGSGSDCTATIGATGLPPDASPSFPPIASNGLSSGPITIGTTGVVAGSYPFMVTATPSAPCGGSSDAQTAPATLIVSSAISSQTITVTTPAPASAIYGNTFPVAATADSGLPVAITATGSCSGTGSDSATITMTSGTGTCVVHYNQEGNGSYSAAPEVTSDTTATKRGVAASITADDKVYDSTTFANVSACALSGQVDGDDISCSSPDGTFFDKHVGTGKAVLVLSGITLGGADIVDYELVSDGDADEANITPYTGVLATATADDKPYDGTTAATALLSFGNIFAGDDLAPSGYTSATFDTADVGTDKTVTVTGITGTGADVDNYTWNTSDTDLANITIADSTTVVTCPPEVEYTGLALTPCSVLVTGVGGLSLTPDPVYTDNTNVGTANASYTYAGDLNHTGSSDSQDFEITFVPVTITGEKYDDKNGDGDQDIGDDGIPNWPVALAKVMPRPNPSEPAGPGNEIPIEIVQLQLTGGTGQYQFPGVGPGEYLVIEGKDPAWQPTFPQIDSFFDVFYEITNPAFPGAGAVQPPAIESFFDVFVQVSGQPVSQGLPSVGAPNTVGVSRVGPTPVPLTFGNFELGSIHGFKFEDLDGDGAAHEVGEPFLGNWTIRLYDASGSPWILVDSDVTDLITGEYSFEGLAPGSYKVCEVLESGWTQTFASVPTTNGSPASSEEGPDCQTVNIDTSGEDNTKNFGNFELVTVTVQKDVVNPDEDDVNDSHVFHVTLDDEQLPGSAIDEGQEAVYGGVRPGPHTLAEIGDPDFDLLRISVNGIDDATPQDGATFSPTSGQDVTVVVTNKQQKATLHIIKDLVTDNGGNETPDDFSFSINGDTPTDFELGGTNDVLVNPGTYTITEPTVDAAKYTTSFSLDCEDVLLGSNGEATCTITNDDVAPILHLRKVVVIDHGGTATVADFALTAEGTGSNDLTGTSPVDSDGTLQADTFAVSEISLGGYSQSELACVGGTLDGINITLGIGEEATCTITNDDMPGTIKGVKFEDKNGNGTKDAEDTTGLAGWTIFLDANDDGTLDVGEVSTVTGADGSYEFVDLSTGVTYKVREVLQPDWVQTTNNPADIELDLGETMENVDFGNFELVTVTGKKYYDTDETLTLAGWPIFADYDGDGLKGADEPQVLTDATGEYTLPVGPGNPNVSICEIRGGWIQTFPVIGTNCGTNGLGHEVTPTSGGSIGIKDFGNKLQALPPISLTKKDFQKGSTIPVKFPSPTGDPSATLLVCPGTSTPSDLPATLCVLASSSGGANTSNEFRYDTTADQYIYNLSTKMDIFTKPLTYGLWVTLGGIGPVLLQTITIK